MTLAHPDILSDWTADLTDVWAEATDPDGEFGESCDGLFSVDWEAYEYPDDHLSYPVLTLDWLVVEDRHATRTIKREFAIRVLGIDAVQRIELIEAERYLEAHRG